MINRRAAKVILSILVAAGSALAVTLYATASGFCISELRRLSNRDALEAVFSTLNARYSDSQGRNSAPYDSLDQYLALHPGCCSVQPDGKYAGHPDLWDRLNGSVAFVVEIEFYKRWKRIDGEIEFDSQSNIPAYFVTACGKPWRI